MTENTNSQQDTPKGMCITFLADLPGKTLLDETRLADALSVSKRTVRRMVSRFELPPPVRFAGRATWQVGRVLAWFEQQADRLAQIAEKNAVKLRSIN